jgi:hypothetical protein
MVHEEFLIAAGSFWKLHHEVDEQGAGSTLTDRSWWQMASRVTCLACHHPGEDIDFKVRMIERK